mgnify:CR=1 FL=1
MNCKEVAQQLAAYPQTLSRDIKKHIEVCADCQALQSQMQILEQISKKTNKTQTCLSEDLKNRLMRLIKNQ